MERALATNVFSFGRKNGIKIEAEKKRWNAQLAVLIDDAKDDRFNDSIVFAARGAYRVYRGEEKSQFVHLGASYSARGATERLFDIDEPALAPIFGNTFRSPNYLEADVDTASVEALWGFKKYLVQLEYYHQSLEEAYGSRFDHSGYYALVNYPIIGSPREYRKGKIRSAKGNKTNVELAVRWSHADVANFGEGDVASVKSFILNYFSFKRYRASLEYSIADIDQLDDFESIPFDARSVTARFQLML